MPSSDSDFEEEWDLLPELDDPAAHRSPTGSSRAAGPPVEEAADAAPSPAASAVPAAAAAGTAASPLPRPGPLLPGGVEPEALGSGLLPASLSITVTGALQLAQPPLGGSELCHVLRRIEALEAGEVAAAAEGDELAEPAFIATSIKERIPASPEQALLEAAPFPGQKRGRPCWAQHRGPKAGSFGGGAGGFESVTVVRRVVRSAGWG